MSPFVVMICRGADPPQAIRCRSRRPVELERSNTL